MESRASGDAQRTASYGWAGKSCCGNPNLYIEYSPEWAAGKLGRTKCARPNSFYCVSCGKQDFGRCKSSRKSQCRHCASIYRGEVEDVVAAGLQAHFAKRDRYAARSAYFLTITAPGDTPHCGNVKHLRKGRGCMAGGNGAQCFECACTPKEFCPLDVAGWHRSLTKRFSHLIQAGRRGEWVPEGRRVPVRFEYVKVAEGQKRGALHFHFLITSPDGGSFYLNGKAFRESAMAHGFGHASNVQPVKPGGGGQELGGVPRYLAKYVSDSADDRPDVPWRDEKDNPCPGRFRTWSRSGGWGATMSGIRAARRSRASGGDGAAGAEGARAPAPPLLDASTVCSTINTPDLSCVESLLVRFDRRSLWEALIADRSPPNGTVTSPVGCE